MKQITILSGNETWSDDFAGGAYGWSPSNIYDSDIHGFWATNDPSILTRTFELPQTLVDRNVIYNVTVSFSLLAGSTWDTSDIIAYSIELDDGTLLADGETTLIRYNSGSQNGWIVTTNPYTEISGNDFYGTYSVSDEFIYDPSEHTSNNLVLEFYWDGTGSGQAITDEFWGVDSITVQVETRMFWNLNLYVVIVDQVFILILFFQ